MRSDLGHPAHPPVSVVMTVLNESRHLSGAVRSVFNQDYRGTVELIVSGADKTGEGFYEYKR